MATRRYSGVTAGGYHRFKYLHPRGLSKEEGSLSRARQRKHGAKKRAALHKFTLAQLNPFNRDCYDCRVPDTNTAPSTPFSTYDEYNIGSGAFPNASCNIFMPNLRNMYCFPAGAGGSATSWNWSAINQNSTVNYTALDNQFGLYRPVSLGIRITCPLAATSASGYVHLCLFSASTSNSSANLPSNLTEMATCPFYKRINLASIVQTPVIYVSKYMDESAHLYRDINNAFQFTGTTGAEIQTNWGWMTIMCVVEGYPNGGNPLGIEVVGHYEGQSKFAAMITDIPAEMPNAPVMAATSAITAMRDPLVDGVESGAAAAAGVAGQVAEYLDDVYGDMVEGAAQMYHPIAGFAVNRARTYIPRKAKRRLNYKESSRSYKTRGIPGVTTNLPMLQN